MTHTPTLADVLRAIAADLAPTESCATLAGKVALVRVGLVSAALDASGLELLAHDIEAAASAAMAASHTLSQHAHTWRSYARAIRRIANPTHRAL